MKIYLDYAATTPVDPRVSRAMQPYFNKKFGNSASLHSYGREASMALEKSRATVAQFIGAKPGEIIFTSSATESNNLAIKGIALASHSGKKHIIVSRIEHDCVLESARFLQRHGFEVSFLPVNENGLIDFKILEKTIKKETLLVSIIHGNNEVGTIQNIVRIGRLCRKNGVYFHTDAVQTLGKVKINVSEIDIDLLTASSHKIYGPKGVAFLYVRDGVFIEPILHGGGQENKLRSSTINIPGVVGMAKAIEILSKEGESENKKLTGFRDYLIDKILGNIPNTQLNGDREKRLSNNINISFFGVEGESLLLELDHGGVCVSTGSACSSKTLEPSHVLLAMGLTPAEAHGSLRITLGRWTTKRDLDSFLEILKKAVNKFRKFSPTYVLH